MKQNLHITLTVMSGIILAGLLAGCPMPTKEGIARNSTEYNLIAEKAGNEMLLLNIVRASKRRPMYFTSFGRLTGNMTFAIGTGAINIPFGKNFDDPYSITPNAGYEYSPLFDVAVLDTQEFTRGIMTPVPMSTIAYYRSLGWPKEILLHLFIRRIDIKDSNNPNSVKPYVNDPEDEKRFNDFQNLIRTEQWDIIVDRDPNLMKIGKVGVDQALTLQNLTEVQKARLELRPGNSGMDLYLSQDKYVFTRKVNKNEKPKTFTEKQGRTYIRSPEAILYYLGEIMRVENRAENPYIPMIDVSHDPSVESPARLFYARACDEDVTPCVSVDYEGTRYVIPGDPDPDDGRCVDRSMHVLSLVSQLIGLQKTSEEAPGTGVVSVVGR
jgi:hypothetical protein